MFMLSNTCIRQTATITNEIVVILVKKIVNFVILFLTMVN